MSREKIICHIVIYDSNAFVGDVLLRGPQQRHRSEGLGRFLDTMEANDPAALDVQLTLNDYGTYMTAIITN
jgi:hypothetical protein